jgi:hypothetical protein
MTNSKAFQTASSVTKKCLFVVGVTSNLKFIATELHVLY